MDTLPRFLLADAWPLLLPTVAVGLLGLVMAPMEVPHRMEPWLAPMVGAATGLVTAATGVFVLPAVPYLQGLRLGKEDLVQGLGLAFTVSTFALAASLALGGDFTPAVAASSLYALVPALGGMLLGQWIRARIRPAVFRRIFFLGLLALGAHLSLRSLL